VVVVGTTVVTVEVLLVVVLLVVVIGTYGGNAFSTVLSLFLAPFPCMTS
jgi:hypothetical protein